MPEQEQLASQLAQSMLAASQSIGQTAHKSLQKKRIISISTPLPRIPSIEEEEVTTKRAAVPQSKSAAVPQSPIEPAIIPPIHGENDDEEIEEIRESLANQQTHMMPISPRVNEVAAREVFSERSTSVLTASPHAIDTEQTPDEQSRQYSQKQHILPFPMLPTVLSHGKLSHILLVLVILAPFIIGGGVLEAAQLNQHQSDLYQVNALTGGTQWQQTPSSPLQVAHADAQGSLLNVDTSTNLHQLVALNANGATLWKTAPSRQSYSLLPTAQPDSVLIALSGHITATTPLSNTATYLNPLVLSLLNRQNGHMLWQTTLVHAQQAQGATISGTDSTYIYVALAQTELPAQHIQPGVQLLAISQRTGQVVWRIADTSQGNVLPQDTGYLVIQKNVVVWQVAGMLNAIDTTQGKLLWQKFIEEPRLSMLPQEEAQMAVTDGDILLERNSFIRALDLMTGNAQWEISNPSLNTGNGLSISSIVTYGNTVFLYDHEYVEAVDANTQHIVWSQKQLDFIHNLNISVDGSLVYLTTTDSIEGSAPTQALVALDSKNGAVRWTFQPSEQVSFVSLQPNGILYNRNVLLTLFCPTLPPAPCTQQYLYALNPTAGTERWKYTGNSITNVSLGDDGKTVLFQRNSSAWLDLTEQFRNS